MAMNILITVGRGGSFMKARIGVPLDRKNVVFHRISAAGIVSDLASRIGVVFKGIPGGEFIYQRGKDHVDSYEIAETPFTIGQMKKLLELKGDEVRKIFKTQGLGIDTIIWESIERAAKDVPEEQKDNCPLVYVDPQESQAVAELVGARLLTEKEWERAAAGKDGEPRPWGKDLDPSKAVYNDSGTRPVKSKPAGKSDEGVYDLIGNVWEWVEEAVLRGGSWSDDLPACLQANCRDKSLPGGWFDFVGFRLARTVK